PTRSARLTDREQAEESAPTRPPRPAEACPGHLRAPTVRGADRRTGMDRPAGVRTGRDRAADPAAGAGGGAWRAGGDAGDAPAAGRTGDAPGRRRDPDRLAAPDQLR